MVIFHKNLRRFLYNFTKGNATFCEFYENCLFFDGITIEKKSGMCYNKNNGILSPEFPGKGVIP